MKVANVILVWFTVQKHQRLHKGGHIWFNHVPMVKLHILPAATMRGMFCKFCWQWPLYICPRHLPIIFKWFILQNWKCYMVFCYLDAIFSIILWKANNYLNLRERKSDIYFQIALIVSQILADRICKYVLLIVLAAKRSIFVISTWSDHMCMWPTSTDKYLIFSAKKWRKTVYLISMLFPMFKWQSSTIACSGVCSSWCILHIFVQPLNYLISYTDIQV